MLSTRANRMQAKAIEYGVLALVAFCELRPVLGLRHAYTAGFLRYGAWWLRRLS